MITASGSQRRSLDGAALTVLAASLPGRAVVPRSAVDAMLAIDITKVPSQPAGSRRLIGAAILRSRVYSALATDIVDLADVEAVWLPKTTADQLPLDLRSLCHAAVAEAYMTCGLVRQATHQARLACDYANEADNDACRYRALSLLACNLALNGEFARAEEASVRCGELDVEGRWPQNTAALPVLLAEMMTAYARLDVEPLVALLERFAKVGCACSGRTTTVPCWQRPESRAVPMPRSSRG